MLTLTTLALAFLHITSCFALALPVLNRTDSDLFERRFAIENHITTRETLEIFWSCIATTFSCTWITVHPNIEFHGHLNWSRRLFLRLYLMAVTLIMPEAMVMWAGTQFATARKIKAEVNKHILKQDPSSLSASGDDAINIQRRES